MTVTPWLEESRTLLLEQKRVQAEVVELAGERDLLDSELDLDEWRRATRRIEQLIAEWDRLDRQVRHYRKRQCSFWGIDEFEA